jgi:hypothetical protein
MNITNIDMIVLPPLHILEHYSPGKFVANINPTDLTAVTKHTSPWRNVYCEVGPRDLTRKLLVGRAECPVNSVAATQ